MNHSIIKPTIGRRLWYWPAKDDFDSTRGMFRATSDQAFDAGVVYVHNDRLVNLSVTDHAGRLHARANVLLVQEGDPIPTDSAYVQWMPYQAGQAKAAARPPTFLSDADQQRARIDRIAQVCHEVNRAYCEALGDNSQPAWADAPAWQRESARMGVDLHLSGDFGPEASHISWMKQKVDEGWVYGAEKNPDLKTHHCIVPFAQLPREQQAKDFIFRAVVHALRG